MNVLGPRPAVPTSREYKQRRKWTSSRRKYNLLVADCQVNAIFELVGYIQNMASGLCNYKSAWQTAPAASGARERPATWLSPRASVRQQPLIPADTDTMAPPAMLPTRCARLPISYHFLQSSFLYVPTAVLVPLHTTWGRTQNSAERGAVLPRPLQHRTPLLPGLHELPPIPHSPFSCLRNGRTGGGGTGLGRRLWQ